MRDRALRLEGLHSVITANAPVRCRRTGGLEEGQAEMDRGRLMAATADAALAKAFPRKFNMDEGWAAEVLRKIAF